MKSYPGNDDKGPFWPNPVIEQYIIELLNFFILL